MTFHIYIYIYIYILGISSSQLTKSIIFQRARAQPPSSGGFDGENGRNMATELQRMAKHPRLMFVAAHRGLIYIYIYVYVCTIIKHTHIYIYILCIYIYIVHTILRITKPSTYIYIYVCVCVFYIHIHVRVDSICPKCSWLAMGVSPIELLFMSIAQSEQIMIQFDQDQLWLFFVVNYSFFKK